jgi:hypothetical protein
MHLFSSNSAVDIFSCSPSVKILGFSFRDPSRLVQARFTVGFVLPIFYQQSVIAVLMLVPLL